MLGWPDESKYYKRVDESLNRWVGVTLHYNNTWWDNKTKRYLSAKLHIIESVIIDDERAGRVRRGGLPFSSFTWNTTFIESCQADNLKRLDLDRYFAFRSAISKRVYRFLDKRFYLRAEWEFDLKEFAFEHVGLSRNYASNAGKIKEKLQPALDELEGIDFLEPLPRDERYRKNGREWVIRLCRPAGGTAPPPLDVPAGERSTAAGVLVARGVTEATADDLARHFAPEAITAKVEVFDWLTDRKETPVSGSTPPAIWSTRSARTTPHPRASSRALTARQGSTPNAPPHKIRRNRGTRSSTRTHDSWPSSKRSKTTGAP